MLKERLVEPTTQGGSGLAVSLLAIAGKREHLIESGLDVNEQLLRGRQPVLGGVKFPGDAVLLGLEQVDRDGVDVMSLQQLLPFVGELGDPGGLMATLQLGIGSAGAEPVTDVLADRFGAFGCEADDGVVFLDECLDLLDAHGLLDAGVPLLMPSDTDEVGIDGTVPVLGMADYESGAASAAEDRSLQVVLVSPLLLARQILGV